MRVRNILTLVLVSALSACAATKPAEVRGSDPATMTGAWIMTIESPVGTRDSRAEFSQLGEQVSGRIVSQKGEVPMTGVIRDDQVAFDSNVTMEGESLEVAYTGKIAGDAMAGTVRFGDFGSGKWVAKRR